MRHCINRRTLLGRGAGILGATSFGSALPAAEDQAATSSPVRACGAIPLAQDYTVIHHNPDRELYVEGCGLVMLPDGTLVAVVPVVPRSATGGWAARPSTTHVVRSGDGGQSWTEVAQLPYYTAVPWVHDGALYLFACKAGTTYRNDDLFLLRSRDAGASWTEPITLFEGHYWNCHTGMVQREGRIYWALCEFYGSPSLATCCATRPR